MFKKFFGGGDKKKETKETKAAAPPPAPAAAAVSPPTSPVASKPAMSRSTTSDSANREELMGNRKQAATNGTAKPNGAPKTPTSPAGGGGGDDDDDEEEDVDALKTQIRFVKQESLASTQNALRAAQQAEETGQRTLKRLGEQGDKLINTEKNLNVAKAHGKVAEGKAKELKSLNRSMFAVRVGNPFNSGPKPGETEEDILKAHQAERDERAATRAQQYNSQQRVGKALNASAGGFSGKKQSLADRAKYQFEADEEDDRIENEIDDNLDAIGAAAGRLKMLAQATGKEVDEQNERITRLNKLTETVDDGIKMNTERLKKISG